MSGRKYDVISQNGDCSRESNVLLFFETKSVIKTPLDFFLRGIVKDMFTRPL
jgi:hypothetical protein